MDSYGLPYPDGTASDMTCPAPRTHAPSWPDWAKPLVPSNTSKHI